MNKDLWGRHCIVDDGQMRLLGVCVGGFEDVYVFKKDGNWKWVQEQYFTIVIGSGASITVVP
jgi:hypothetical protein